MVILNEIFQNTERIKGKYIRVIVFVYFYVQF